MVVHVESPPSAPVPRLAVPGALVLEDGAAYVGTLFGAGRETAAEVVFNTGMTGYQEICTDPSYRGQMVVLTHPQIGNYGVDLAVAESTRPWVAGLIVRELALEPHHWRASEPLDAYLARHGVTGLEGIDTRALTRRLRRRGALRGVLAPIARPELSTGEHAALLQRARQLPALSERDVVSEVVGAASAAVTPAGTGPRVVVLDCGAKHNIVRSLQRRGAAVTTVGADATLETILAARPAGVVLANGPGDPAALPGVVGLVRDLLRTDLPIFGICLGHQLLALAVGATTSRLPFGHHGSNHPVQDVRTGAVHITAQNHEFQVDRDSLPAASGFYVSHINLNDGSVEGLAHRERPVFSVQFHPEGCPGPQDNQYLFDEFFALLAARVGE
ncbi:MAG TPA: glutamine-hydrolyzing carbamoyl-phosphate synthase small subunit [Chloroflexota bacterium]|nr:glutamine-hydrolyzing carbamoyl-phosphate synthase small subunit [Chloroflexota bacterium]